MSDSPVKSNLWTWLTSLSPVILAIAPLLLGAGGASLYHRMTPTTVAKSGLPAADVPKDQSRLPTPIACAEDFHAVEVTIKELTGKQAAMAADLAELSALARDRFPPSPRRAPSKIRALAP